MTREDDNPLAVYQLSGYNAVCHRLKLTHVRVTQVSKTSVWIASFALVGLVGIAVPSSDAAPLRKSVSHRAPTRSAVSSRQKRALYSAQRSLTRKALSMSWVMVTVIV